MLKRVKSVSMLLFLMAASTGSMNAVSAPAIASWVKQSSVRP